MAIFGGFVTELVLPFLLVFVVVFAVLQKSKILGENKSQVDALVGMVIGLIVIGFPGPREIIVGLMPWMAVGLAVLLVFFILYGFVAGDLSEAEPWMKITFGILAGLFTIGVVIYVTGFYKIASGLFDGASGSTWLLNGVIIVLVIAAMVVAVKGTGGKLPP